MSQYFREEALQKALDILVTPGNGNGRIDTVLSHVQLSQENNSCVDSLRACQDPVAEWWAAALATGALWALDQAEEAQKKYYKVVQTVPEEVRPNCFCNGNLRPVIFLREKFRSGRYTLKVAVVQMSVAQLGVFVLAVTSVFCTESEVFNAG